MERLVNENEARGLSYRTTIIVPFFGLLTGAGRRRKTANSSFPAASSVGGHKALPTRLGLKFIHSVVPLATCPQLLPKKRVLQIVQCSDFYFKIPVSFLSLSSCLRLLPHLIPSIFPSITRQFLRNMYQIQLVFLYFVIFRMFLSLSNCLRLLPRRIPSIFPSITRQFPRNMYQIQLVFLYFVIFRMSVPLSSCLRLLPRLIPSIFPSITRQFVRNM